MRLTTCWIVGLLTGMLAAPISETFGQCSPQTGAGPGADYFKTGQVSAGAIDPHWKVALDSINAEYIPAVLMQSLPISYHNAPYWISFSSSGEHNHDQFFFFKITFDLPCFNLCGKSFDDDNAFCLDLDLYSDNSVYEIYINGKPQSTNLGNIIPVPHPFNPDGHPEANATTVQLCWDWKAGANTLIIQIASSATVAGLEIEPSIKPMPPPNADTISNTICDGEAVNFGGQVLTKSGYYFHSFSRPSGCDSNVVLHLLVNQKPQTIIDTTICDGDNFEGYTTNGTFVNVYKAVNGCDSTRQLHLTVHEKPKPQLPGHAGICTGDSLVLSAGEFHSYVWQDGSNANHFIARKPGLYSVTVSNNCGTASASTVVTDGICKIYFPSAFTPNFDLKNDYFKILTDLKFQDFHLFVYNRWGQQLFESKDPLRGWDGKLNGKDEPPGVYAWRCVFTRSNVSTQLNGTVLLIR